jgi:hypothetical protein
MDSVLIFVGIFICIIVLSIVCTQTLNESLETLVTITKQKKIKAANIKATNTVTGGGKSTNEDHLMPFQFPEDRLF